MSADRWRCGRNGWSGTRARSSQERQNRSVALILRTASSTFSGVASPSDHEIAQYAVSPSDTTWRARADGPSIPMSMSVASRKVCPAPVASAAWSPTMVHVAGLRP